MAKTKEERSNSFNQSAGSNIIPLMKQYICSSDVLEDFIEYQKETFVSVFEETVGLAATEFFAEETGINLEEGVLSSIVDLVYEAVKRKELYESYTGIVFAGFGTDDLFPKLMSYRIGGVVNSTIRYTVDDDTVRISNNNPSAIKPFAQTDIIDSFLYGIDPNVINALPELFSQTINEVTDGIIAKIPQEQAHFKLVVEETKSTLMDELSKSFSVKLANKFIQYNFYPILSTIGNLSKEDLAEMAESLINLTYLKRRFTFADESVGGPVDIAIITKGDGFVWIKRKHYFKPEINLHYLASVFNNK